MRALAYRYHSGSLAACAKLALAVACCGGDMTTPARSGLEPLEAENRASWPAATPDDAHPEAVAYATGSTDTYDWAHARGWVHADVAEVWSALQAPDVVYDRGANDWTATYQTRPEYAYSFRLHYTAGPPLLSVEYDVDWWEGVVEGTLDAPVEFAARYQKTSGTTFIQVMEGSVRGRSVAPGVTSLEMIAHLKAAQSGAADARSGLNDIFLATVARVHR